METRMNVDVWRSECREFLSMFDKKSNDNKSSIPRIYIPNEKIELLVSWYRDNYKLINDIIPIFNEYYLTIDLRNIIHIIKPTILSASQFLSIDDYNLALNIASAFEDFFNCLHCHIIHKDGRIKLSTYSNKNRLIGIFQIQDNKTSDDFYDTKALCNTFKDLFNDAATNNKVEYFIDMSKYVPVDQTFHQLINALNTLQVCLFASVNYYIFNYATENLDKDNLIKNLDNTCKTIIPKDNRDYKFLTKPLYDIGKLRIPVQSSRRSYEHTPPNHAFMVKGHWRHYKSGKKVFINSYIKCEERGNLVNNIIVKPRKREMI